jgi:hypothetical protein
MSEIRPKSNLRDRVIVPDSIGRHTQPSQLPQSRPSLPPPARIKLSALGAARCPRLADREGVIVGGGRYPSTVRVIFDGSKSPMSLHRDYIELCII